MPKTINEQIESILGKDLTLNEGTITQIAETLSTALLEQKVQLGEAQAAEIAALNEAHAAALVEAGTVAQAKLDEAVDVAVEAVLNENADKFVQADEHARMSNAVGAIKAAFEANGFTLDESAPLTEATAKLAAADVEYKALFEKNTALKAELNEALAELELAKRSIIFEAATRDLPDTKREKVGALAEAVTFADTAEFRAGLALIVEQVKDKADKDGDGDGKKDADGDGEDDDKAGKDGDGKGKKAPPFGKKDTMNESVQPAKKLSEMTFDERRAFYAKAGR